MVCVDVQKISNGDSGDKMDNNNNNNKSKLSGWMIFLIICIVLVIIGIVVTVVVVLVFKKLTFISNISYSLDPGTFYDSPPLEIHSASSDVQPTQDVPLVQIDNHELNVSQKFYQNNNFYYDGSLDPQSDDIKNLINKNVIKESLMEDYDSNPEKFNTVVQTIKEIKDIYQNAKDNITNVELIEKLDGDLGNKNTELFHLLKSKPDISLKGQPGFRCKLCQKIYNPYENLVKHHRLKHLDALDYYLAVK